ncbi:MAG TPA: nucleoside hydrolase [Roseiarcus sp.]|nr:nucleoside hydrolase [Roseiarcus sp.]
MPSRLILDVDTGTDDAVAIMLAALHPDLELLAVTTVNGNVEVSRCTDNSLRTLEWIGRGDIPVYEGLARPIVRSDFPVPRAAKRDAKVHPAALPLPEARGSKQSLSAPVFLAESFAKSGADTTLVAVGPLSNLAAAIALDPSFVANVPELMIMGGAINKSNVTPSAEFNIWADPEAAAVVLGAGFNKLTMVPLDATHEALISLDQCRKLRALNSPAGKAAADFIEYRIAGYQANQPTGLPDTAPVHDALCIAALVDSAAIRTERLNVVVETMGEYTIGRTVVDHERRTTRAPNCYVALGADREKFFSILLTTFAKRN